MVYCLGWHQLKQFLVLLYSKLEIRESKKKNGKKEIKTINRKKLSRNLNQVFNKIATKEIYAVDDLNNVLEYDQTLQVLSNQERYVDAAEFALSQNKLEDAKEFFIKNGNINSDRRYSDFTHYSDVCYGQAARIAGQLGQKEEELNIRYDRKCLENEFLSYDAVRVVDLALELKHDDIVKEVFEDYKNEIANGLSEIVTDYGDYFNYFKPFIDMARKLNKSSDADYFCNNALGILQKQSYSTTMQRDLESIVGL